MEEHLRKSADDWTPRTTLPERELLVEFVLFDELSSWGSLRETIQAIGRSLMALNLPDDLRDSDSSRAQEIREYLEPD